MPDNELEHSILMTTLDHVKPYESCIHGTYPAAMLALAKVLDAADVDDADDASSDATKPPVAPSSAIIKVDSDLDVASLVRRCRALATGEVAPHMKPGCERHAPCLTLHSCMTSLAKHACPIQSVYR